MIITTGYYDEVLVDYAQSLDVSLNLTFVKNEKYESTNYIYSIYCAREYLDDDIILCHGDMVFENAVFDELISSSVSSMTVSSTVTLPQKDFKAVIKNGKIQSIGIDFFNEAVAALPLYKINKEDWKIWLQRIIYYVESGEDSKCKCYAENAFNDVSNSCSICRKFFRNHWSGFLRGSTR